MMRYLGHLFVLAIFFSGCSSLPSQVTIQDPQLVSTENSFTWVGLQVGMKNNKSPMIEKEQVVVVFNIYPLSPAMKATVNKNDIIISIDGEKLKDHNDFIGRIKKSIPNKEIRLEVFRDGGFIDLKIKLQAYDMETYVNRVIEYVKETRNDDFAHLILGDYFTLKKDLQKAIEHFKTATIVNSQNSTAYAALAGIYGFELQKYEEGIEYFKKAIFISPNFSNYHFDLGLYYSILKQHENAIEEYQSSINLSPNDSEAYNYLGEEYLMLKKYQKAIKAFENSIRVSPNQFKARLNMGKTKRGLGEDNGALLEFEKLLQLSAKEVMLNKGEEAELLMELGNTYYAFRKFDKSVSIFEKELLIREEEAQEKPHLHLYILRRLGSAYYAIKNYKKALPIYNQAKSISKGLYGESSLKHAIDLGYLANANYALYKWDEAENLYSEAISIHKSEGDTKSYQYLDMLNNLGNCKYARSDYIGAESTHRSVVEITAISNKKNELMMVFGLSGVARSLFSQHKYMEAEQFYLKALALQKKTSGEGSYYASMLGSLGGLYYGMGAQNKAEDVLIKSLKIQEEVEGEYSFSSNNYLGLIYFERLEYNRAMRYFQSAREVVSKLYGMGDRHPESADILYNIGMVYFAQGNYEKALELDEKALKAIPDNEKRYLGIFSRIKMGMGEIYRMKGQFNKSKLFFIESLNIMEIIFEKDNIVMASNLIGAARLDVNLGEYKDAWKKMQRAVSITEKDIDLKYEYTSDYEKIAYFRTLDSDFYVSLVMALAEDREVVREAYGIFLRMKNNVLFSSMDQNKSSDIESKGLKDTITSKRKELARLAYSKSSKNTPERIESEIDELERKLSRVSSRNSKGDVSLDLKAISQNMPKNSILIDFLKASLNRFDVEKITPPGHFISEEEKEKLNPHHYFAMVYSKDDDKLRLLDLGLAKEIDKSIIKFRGDIQALKSSEKIKTLGNKLFKSIFRPASKLIGDYTDIFIAPDSNLALLPFETLVDDNGNYLVDKYKFTYLNSGRDFMGFNVASINSGSVVLFGNPDFDYSADDLKKKLCQGEEKALNRCPEPSEFSFSSLAGTEREVNQIGEVFTSENVITFKSQLASEAALKEIESPNILHIATHGFFLKNIDIGDGNHAARGMVTVSDDEESLGSGMKINNPLLASGIALSGANRVHRGVDEDGDGEDGIVSAMEIMGLNLQGTSLVVLSACNTGVGDVERGQGIFGLRRAFQMAGARSLLMSLWKVPDSETVDLMRRFYLNLYGGKSKVDSLNMSIKDTMREIKNIRGTDHPFYWGGFILIGNPENN
jgi:tetratricopeptide (TPR) repeat protein